MFFSARRVIGPSLRQVQATVQQHLKTGRRVAEVNPHNTVVDLPPVAVPLAGNSHGRFAALGRARLVHTTDGLGVGMILGDDLLAAISEFLFIPLDRFEKALQRPRRGLELQADRLGRLAMQVRELAFDINPQQSSCIASAKTIGKQREKQTELPSQRGNLF